MDDREMLDVAVEVTRRLQDLGIDYVVGGSLASSMHGIPRATQDADILVFLSMKDVDSLVASFTEEFYVSEDAVRDAVRRESSFNLVHFETALKIDLFVAGDEPWLREEKSRRRSMSVADGKGALFVSSAEDNILHKLQWYEDGNRVSDQQWKDVLGVMKVQGEDLDIRYLLRWAVELGVEALCRQALDEAGLV